MKPRYLILLAILALIFGLAQLNMNTRHALRLRDQIINKDQAAQPVAQDIATLTDYVHSHMRTDVKFELAGSYQRAVTAAQPAVNGAVYAQAQSACSGRSDSVTQARCVTDFVSRRLPATPPAPPPDRAKYTYDIHSPAWTPNAAGSAFLLALVLVLSAAAIKVIHHPGRH
jgi:dihydroxyacetone kinase DhaKLM complex PTS-EIIA-like component DhaM